ncbi:MAG: GGDEF domain-containing protein [Gammaproteobacteria bacterium]
MNHNAAGNPAKLRRPNPVIAAPVRGLVKSLGHSRHVEAVLEDCLARLSSVTRVLTEKCALNDAVESVRIVEANLRASLHEMSAVNRALANEDRERSMLDHRFAASVEQEEFARHAAFHDVLTQLPNRALFDNRLEHELAQAQRHGRRLALLFIDLNDFKTINDTYGHDAGDAVLRTIATRLKEHIRDGDTVSRHGGDEFLYLAAEFRDKAAVILLAKRISKLIQCPCIVKDGDLDVSVSVHASIGISVSAGDRTTPASLIRSADEAMYRAKQGGFGYSLAV